MSDKSKIEGIRARDAGRKYVTGIIEAQVWQDRRALLSHADEQAKRIVELEAELIAECESNTYLRNLNDGFDKEVKAADKRIARLEGALSEIQFGELQCDYCQENMRVARAALAGAKGGRDG